MNEFKPKKKMDDFLYKKESRFLIQGCKEVYGEFGGSFKENIIEKSLAIWLRKQGLKVERQKRLSVMFDGKRVGNYVIDLVINDKIMVELKVKSFLTVEDQKQFWRYLKASDYKLGYLINFGSQCLEIKRRIYDKARRVTGDNLRA